MTDPTPPESDFWGEPIAIYTRAQAIADGVLIDVSAWARAIGFRAPVAVTAGLWALLNERLDADGSIERRTSDVLRQAAESARAMARHHDTLTEFHAPIGERIVTLWLVFEPHEGYTIGPPIDF